MLSGVKNHKEMTIEELEVLCNNDTVTSRAILESMIDGLSAQVEILRESIENKEEFSQKMTQKWEKFESTESCLLSVISQHDQNKIRLSFCQDISHPMP